VGAATRVETFARPPVRPPTAVISQREGVPPRRDPTACGAAPQEFCTSGDVKLLIREPGSRKFFSHPAGGFLQNPPTQGWGDLAVGRATDG